MDKMADLILLSAMKKKGDRMMEDLKYVQNFDFNNASAEDLEKMDEFLQSKITAAEKTKKDIEKVVEALDNKE